MGSLTSEESKRINDIAIGVATGVTASVAAGIAIDVLCGILTTNYENKTIAGDVVMKPTKQETDLQSSKTGASSNDAVVAKDDVYATKQQADANTTDAIASDLGASAMKTKAGAMDIATKAMKLN